MEYMYKGQDHDSGGSGRGSGVDGAKAGVGGVGTPYTGTTAAESPELDGTEVMPPALLNVRKTPLPGEATRFEKNTGGSGQGLGLAEAGGGGGGPPRHEVHSGISELAGTEMSTTPQRTFTAAGKWERYQDAAARGQR